MRGLSESNLASASLLNAIAPFLAANMQAKISKKTFKEGSPFAAASIEASAKGSAKSVWLKRTNFAYSVIFVKGIACKVEISILQLRLKQHKMRNVVFFFLVFFGIAFSQDSSSVLLPKDSLSVVKDSATALIDTTVKVAVDTAIKDTTVKDTTKTAPTDTASTSSAKIKPGLHFFVSAGAHFITFEERSTFQTLLISKFNEYEDDYKIYKDSGSYAVPVKQDFETVNLTFPISAGIMWQFSEVHSLGLGVGFLYNTESVILTDKDSKNHNFEYTIQAFPAFVEYRLLISPNLISLRDNDYFSLFLRYYWLLPPTEIKSSWGKAKADFEPKGNGYGVFLGYRFWEWMGLSIFGEMGLVSLDAKSSSENRVLDSWNLGGISIFIRALF